MATIALRAKDSPTYNRVLELAEQLMPKEFDPETRIIGEAPESREARKYRQMATAENNNGKRVTPLSLVERDIAKYRDLIQGNPDGGLLKSDLNTLLLVRAQLKATKNSETQSIFRDAVVTGLDLNVSGKGQGYTEYRIDDRRVIRVNVFHPDELEHRSGADLLYEYLDHRQKTGRVAAVQYKVWDHKEQSLHWTKGMGRQLEKLYQFACDKDYSPYQVLCKDDPVPRGLTYRLPYCAAFLRPTDRLQYPDSAMSSTGFHVPICVAAVLWSKNQKGGQSIRKDQILDRSISQSVFKELFFNKMMGSREMSWGQMADLYKKIGIFESGQTVVVHAQEFEDESKAG